MGKVVFREERKGLGGNGDERGLGWGEWNMVWNV